MSTLYGKLKETRGGIQNYLGITLDYKMARVVCVSMVEYTKGIIENFPEVIEEELATLAPNHLFLVRDKKEATKLPDEQAMHFHHTVVQLLFLRTQAW